MYETDQRLKCYLDTNQLHREQLCLAVLALDKRFTDVRPRHPRGGPDGGRDIEATYQGDQLTYAAVGFVVQANDSIENKQAATRKFKEDLESAWAAQPSPKVFVFFTNVSLTAGEKSALVTLAMNRGFSYCDIFDRERVRIALDSADGFAARFQYLGLPMSDAEQASFFAKWGDDINSVITTGFQKVHSTLAHLLFLQEAQRPMAALNVYFQLDKEYGSDELGHFRAFMSVYLKEPKAQTLQLLFGTSDKAHRFAEPESDRGADLPGIKHGISTGQWRVIWPEDVTAEGADAELDFTYQTWVSGRSIGRATASGFGVSFDQDYLVRTFPTLKLADLDEAMLMPIVSQALAPRIKNIKVYANGYLLLDVPAHVITVDRSEFKLEGVDDRFGAEELADTWVRLRPKDLGANWLFSFSSEVPVRMFSSKLATEVHSGTAGDA